MYPCSTKTREVWYWEIHPRRPKDFPRPERFPEGEARGKSRGSREIWRAEGMDFPIPPEFWWSTDNLSASIFLQGVDQKILPCGQGRIDSVKINPSLLMMRDCSLLLLLTFISQFLWFLLSTGSRWKTQELKVDWILCISRSSTKQLPRKISSRTLACAATRNETKPFVVIYRFQKLFDHLFHKSHGK